MAKLIVIEPIRTYATHKNAVKSVEAKVPADKLMNCRYIVMTDENGRFFPVFIGAQALQEMLHFHFNVLG